MLAIVRRWRRTRLCDHWLHALEHPRTRREWRDYILLQLALVRAQIVDGKRNEALARIVRLAERLRR